MGSSSSTAGLMSQLLAEKELKHSLLLQCLADSAVLYALPAGVLRCAARLFTVVVMLL